MPEVDGGPHQPLLTDEVRELVRLVQGTDIAELLIQRGDATLHVKRAISAPAAGVAYTLAPVAAHAHAAPAAHEPAVQPEIVTGHTITAPMVGTYYAASSPKDAPFVHEGDEVKVGAVVGIIEAMKIMNEIESDVSGRIVRIMVKNGQPVEYGQALMVVEPA